MRRIVTGLAAIALVLGATVIAAGPASSAAPSATWAWTLVQSGGDCGLGKIDLATGAVTELAGPASPEGCVQDIAAGPDGSVWGIGFDVPVPAAQGFNAPQAASNVRLVRYSPTTGAPVSSVQVDVPGGGTDTWLAHGGIAITSDGTVWIQIVDDACDSGNSVCLYTVNPTTGLAAQVGSSTLTTTYLDGLAICGTGPVTLIEYLGGPAAQPQALPPLKVGSVDAGTGKVTAGATTSGGNIGYDCGGATTGYALLTPEIVVPGAVPQATGADLVSFNPTTGATATIAAVSPSDVDISLLAIPVPTQPSTTTTTAAPTTTAAAAQPATVTPRFTG